MQGFELVTGWSGYNFRNNNKLTTNIFPVLYRQIMKKIKVKRLTVAYKTNNQIKILRNINPYYVKISVLYLKIIPY